MAVDVRGQGNVDVMAGKEPSLWKTPWDTSDQYN